MKAIISVFLTIAACTDAVKFRDEKNRSEIEPPISVPVGEVVVQGAAAESMPELTPVAGSSSGAASASESIVSEVLDGKVEESSSEIESKVDANIESKIESDSKMNKLCNGAERINIILVFDNSGSQSSSDLMAMRRGSDLISQSLVRIKSVYPTLKLEAAVIRFAKEAFIGSNSWIELGTTVPADLNSDIMQATKDKGGSTEYLEALTRITELHSIRPELTNFDKARNFVIFMSDGNPDDKESEILNRTQSIVDKYRTRFVTVAIGSDDLDVLKQMSLISGASKQPGGSLFHFVSKSKDDAEVEKTFGNVAGYFDGICNGSLTNQ